MRWSEHDLRNAVTSVRLSGFDADGRAQDIHVRSLAEAVTWATSHRCVTVWGIGHGWPRTITRIRPLTERNRIARAFDHAVRAHVLDRVAEAA